MPGDSEPAPARVFEAPEVVAVVGLALATLAKSIASLGLTGFIAPSVVYVVLIVALMRSLPASRALRRAALFALLAAGVWSMVRSHNETLLMTMSLLPVAALAAGLATSVLIAVLLAIATGVISVAHGDPVGDQVQWIASVIGGDLFLLAFSAQLLRGRRVQAELRRQSAINQQLAAAAERSRISADLHDGLGHHLTGALIQLEAARAVGAAAPERAQAFLDRARGLIQDAMREVRAAIAINRPGVRGRSFLAALEELVQYNQDAGITTRLRLDPDDPALAALAPEAEYALWRGVQEALTNVRRHADARAVDVSVRADADAVAIVVRDDGQGTAAPVDGLGLHAMRARIGRLGGSVDFTSAARAGSTLTLRVPRPADPGGEGP